jgi:hypothetical protein
VRERKTRPEEPQTEAATTQRRQHEAKTEAQRRQAVQFEWTQLGFVLVLSVVNTAVIDHLKRPVAERFPKLSFWWLPYLVLATGGALCAATDLNVFRTIETMPHALGVGLTSVLVGGGASFVHEVLSLAKKAIKTAVGIITEGE